MVSELNNGNLDENTKQGKVVLDFYADWCAPCKMMEPIFEKAGSEFKDINFFRVDVDKNQQSAMIYAVRSIPTLVFIKNGQEVDRVIGVLHEEDFKHRVKQAFK